MDATGYEVAIEVRRSDTGAYEIPGAAEAEHWHDVRTELGGESEDMGALAGWDTWERVARITDEDGRERWYFLSDTWPPDAPAWDGRRLAEARDARGLTQGQLGERIDVGYQQVSAWERDVRAPGAESLAKLARALGVTTDSLLGMD